MVRDVSAFEATPQIQRALRLATSSVRYSEACLAKSVTAAWVMNNEIASESIAVDETKVRVSEVDSLVSNSMREANKKIHEQKTARLFEFCSAAPFIISNKSAKEINMSRKYGKIIGTVFQIIDDVHDYENKDNEYVNILNVMTKDDALEKCYRYEIEANSLREKLLPNKKNRMNDILSFIINRK